MTTLRLITWAAQRPQIRGRGGLGTHRPDPVAAARAVLHLRRGQISEGAVDQVLGQLQEDFRELERSEAT